MLRMILHNAALRQIIGLTSRFLASIASVVIDEMGRHYADPPASVSTFWRSSPTRKNASIAR